MSLCDEVVLQFLQSSAVAVASQFHNLRLVFRHESVKHRLLLLHGHLSFHLFQFSWFVRLSPNDVELASAAFAVRVHLVACSCRAQCSSLVEELRVYEFRGNSVVWSSHAEVLSSRSPFGVRVASLYHKVFDDTMEQRSVEIALLCEFHEVVTMTRSLVV